MTLVSHISEFELIKKLEMAFLNSRNNVIRDKDILLGIGDDAAIIDPGKSPQVITTDTMVENIHFINDKQSMKDLGWKALAVNYSDIASMGCKPSHTLVTLGLRPNIEIEDLEEIYRGFAHLINEEGGDLVGGDIVKSETFFISVTVVGRSGSKNILRRDTANIGDLIGVTGQLGSSAGGLKILKGIYNGPKEFTAHLISRHRRPSPRSKSGIKLADKGVTTAIDISDGLYADLSKLCKASKVGASFQVDKLPVDEHLKSAFPTEWIELAVSGGEDYELLFTTSEKTVNNLKTEEEISFKIIGEITEESNGVTAFDKSGNQLTFETGGWDHFKKPS